MSCLRCESPTPDLLCTGCTTRLITTLRTLESGYTALAAHLAPRVTSGVRKFTGIKPEASMPMRDQTFDLRAQIVEHACSWADALVEVRALSWRDHYGSGEGRIRRSVKPLVDFMPWAVTEWGAIGDLAEETWQLDRSINSVLDPTPGEKPVRIGICPAVTPEGKCGAVLMHTPGAKALTCRWCSTVYPPVTWLQLKTWMDEDKKEVTAA